MRATAHRVSGRTPVRVTAIGFALSLLCGVLVALSSVGPAAAAPQRERSEAPSSARASAPSRAAAPRYYSWGSARAKTQKLRAHCHRYRYTYRVNAPTDQWLIEIVLVNRRGVNIASNVFDSGFDPAVGRSTWKLCRPTVGAGRYKIKMKVTYSSGSAGYDVTRGSVRPTFFRLVNKR